MRLAARRPVSKRPVKPADGVKGTAARAVRQQRVVAGRFRTGIVGVGAEAVALTAVALMATAGKVAEQA